MLEVNCIKQPRTQDKFKLFFYYNFELITRLKSLPEDDRKFNPSDKSWTVKVLSLFDIITQYKGSTDIKFNFGEQREVFLSTLKKAQLKQENEIIEFNDLMKSKEEWLLFKQDLSQTYNNYRDKTQKHLKVNVVLMQHQIEVIMYMDRVRNLLVSHDMGLGKTISSIAFAEMNEFNKVFVITPNSLKHNFYNEIEKFTNSKAHIIGWKNNIYSINEARYVITNYDYFNPSNKEKMDAKFKKLGIIGEINALICDEAQALKNSDSNTYWNFNRIFNKNLFKDEKICKIFLSGTPAPNRAYELYNVLNQISPLDFKTKKYFYEYFCGMVYDMNAYGGYNTDINITKFGELYEKISPYTHRRKKQDVLDLPEKTYQRLAIDMDLVEEAEYNKIARGVATDMFKKSSTPLVALLRLRQYTASLKAKQLIEIIDSIIETGEKVVIVDFFKDSLNELKKHYGDIAVLHTGDEKNIEIRSEMVKVFQDENSKIKIFLGSIQTCNYGLTLTSANKMFVLTQPYSPGQYNQVCDRIYRIGQKNRVTIYLPIITDTIDNHVYLIVEDKLKETTKVIDNEDYESDVDETAIGEIMKSLFKKYC